MQLREYPLTRKSFKSYKVQNRSHRHKLPSHVTLILIGSALLCLGIIGLYIVL